MPSTMWCMIGLPTITMSSNSSAGASAWRSRSVIRSLSAARMHAVSSLSPPGFIITYETRLMRSSPKRICGFITPAVASTSPVDRSHRWPATVVEPTSMATPSAVSTKPGQMATATPSRSTAMVTEPVIVGCRLVGGAQHRGAPHRNFDAVSAQHSFTDQFGHRFRVAEHRLRHVDVEQPELRVDHQTGEVDGLAHHLLVNLALRRHGNHRVGEHGRRTAEPSPCTKRAAGVALRLVVDLDRRPIRQSSRLRCRLPTWRTSRSTVRSGNARRCRDRRTPSRDRPPTGAPRPTPWCRCRPRRSSRKG